MLGAPQELNFGMSLNNTININMAIEKEIPLNKNIFSIKDAKRFLDRDFIEFLPKKIKINELFDLYDSLFYEIEIYGKKSHASIIKQSSKYAGIPPNPKSQEIENLKDQIQNLKDDIDSIEDEHPIILNRSIVQNRTNNELNYYIESGRKRQIFDDRAFQLIKGQTGYKKNTPNSEFVVLLNDEAIGGIISGPPINTPEDLNIDILEINRYGQKLANIIDYNKKEAN